MKMTPQKILVLGGSGFVGRNVVARLAKQGHSVIVPTRRWSNARALLMLPNVSVVEADILRQPSPLSTLLPQCQAVINLVGVLHGSGGMASGRSYNTGFARAFVECPKVLLQAMSEQRTRTIRQVIHMSALGVSAQAPAQYLRARAEGEALFRHSPVPTTIIRPSIIAGHDAPFFQLMQQLVACLPVIVMPNMDFTMQPVCVEDVAKVICQSLLNPRSMGQTYELGGPEKYTLSELLHTLAALQGKSRILLNLPKPLAQLLALILERLPNPLMTRDSLAMMALGSVTTAAFPFDLRPKNITLLFAQQDHEQDMQRFRTLARR